MKYTKTLFCWVFKWLGSMVLLCCISSGAIATNSSVTETSPPASSAFPAVQEQVVHLNSATVEQLVAGLKGIGIKKAEAIVSYRERYGEFTAIEQLMEVPGIGPAIFERNRQALAL